ncbi:hypothetical protein [Streptomyces sp. NPDC001340]
MNEAWGAVVAAVAAGGFGIIGILAGILVGRRQTTDQASVEHAQWLRGQRREAYIKFLEAWEKALAYYAQFQEQSGTWFQVPPDADPEPYYKEFDEAVSRPINKLRPFQERVFILGPTDLQLGAVAMNHTLIMLKDVLWRSFDRAEPDWVAYRGLLERADEQRRVFVRQAGDVMRTAPRPGSE